MGRWYVRLGVTSTSLKDGLGGRLRLIKGVLRLLSGILGKQYEEEERRGEM
jgi:hypothetical protein